MAGALIRKLLTLQWGAILPPIWKAIAEGEFGPWLARLYWWTAKYKTAGGMVTFGLGWLLSTVGPDPWWVPLLGNFVMALGGLFTAGGLSDGGVRAPWPKRPDGMNPIEVEKAELASPNKWDEYIRG